MASSNIAVDGPKRPNISRSKTRDDSEDALYLDSTGNDVQCRSLFDKSREATGCCCVNACIRPGVNL